MMKRLIGWILSSSIFAACCALALAASAAHLLLQGHIERSPGIDYDVHSWRHAIYLLVFGSTLLEYNVHFLLNTKARGKPALWPWLLVFAGSICCAVTLFGMPASVFVLLAVLGLLALLYSAPKLPFRPKRRIDDRGITKVVVLTGTWVAMTTIIPALFLGLSWHAPGIELLFRFLLIFPLCLAFDLRDLDSDATSGIQTVAGALGEQRTYGLIDLSLAVLVIASLFACLTVHISRPHFLCILLAAAFARGSIRLARQTKHPFMYSGLIDGVMLLYGVLLYLLV